MYVYEMKGSTRSGRPLGRWKDRIKEYINERDATRKG